MRPRERRDSGQNDLFRARLDQIVDLGHLLARLAATIDWRFLEERFGAVYSDKPGQPPLPTRLNGGAFDPQACARSVGRGTLRPVSREPVISGSGCQRSSPIRCPRRRAWTKTGTPLAATSSLNLISGRLRRPRQNPSFRGRGVSTATGPIYFAGRPKPRHGFSRSLPILALIEFNRRAFTPSAPPRRAKGRFRDIAIGRR